MLIKDSPQCGKSELDLFTVPPTQVSIEDGVWDDILPFPNFKTSTVQFEIKADGEHYVDLAQTELWMTLALCKKNTETPFGNADEVNVGLVNNLMHSIFKNCQISVNNIEIENSNSHYPFRAYFENLLCYNHEAKETFLAQELFIKDTYKNMDSFDLKASAAVGATPAVLDSSLNQGLIQRVKRFTSGFGVEVRGPIHADLFKGYRFLLPTVSVQIKFTRHDSTFYLMGSNNDAHIVCQDAFLRIRRNKVNPAIYANHLMQLEKTTAKYPVSRVIMKNMALPFSAQIANLSGIHNGILPTRVVVAFVDTDAFGGDLKKNPFNFKNFNINFLRLKCNARSAPYSSGIRMKYSQNQYLQAYTTLFQDLGGGPNDILYDEYANGFSIYCFDLSPDNCNADHFSILKEGTLDLEVILDKSLTQSITAVFYLEFNNIVEISKQNQVQLDYQV